MSTDRIRISLVTEAFAVESPIVGWLSKLDAKRFALLGATGREAALQHLAAKDCDICILDLSLAGALTFLSKIQQVQLTSLTALVIVKDDSEAHEVIQEGAAGCLVRASLTFQSVERELLLMANRIKVIQSLRAPLKESEARYRRIVDGAKEIIYRIDPTGHFCFVNPTAAAIVQRRAEDSIGLHYISLIRKDYREQTSKFYAEQIRTRNPVTYYEFPAVAADGSEVWIGQNVQLVIENDEVVELQALGRDITACKKIEQQLLDSEQRYRLLFEANPHPMWVYDREDCSILAVNNAAVQSYGYSAEEFLAMTVMDIRPPDEKERFAPRLSAAISNDSSKTRKHLKKDGSIIDVEINGLPVTFDGKNARLITATDVTARLRAEEQLRQSQKMEAVGQLAGGIAHDFNNLLTAISGYSEMALRSLEPDLPVRRHIEEIQKASTRAASLTRQLLAFSRKQVLQPTVLNITAAVIETEKLLRRLIGEDIELITQLTPDVGQTKADPGQIEQVLMNLVVNARDAMPDGGKITIETSNVYLDEGYASKHPSAEVGAYVLLAVSDTGTGMDATVQKRIFEPFFTTKETGKGTGLGLSTVYGVVKQSGGNIAVHSELGKGTSFKVYLPRVATVVQAGRALSAPLSIPPGTETILLVEDEQMVRTMARHILELSGYNVLEAASGSEAMEICKDHIGTVHLLLTDVVMPKMSGPRLSEEVMKMCPHIGILYMSGYTDNVMMHHGVLKEGVSFLQKPFSPDALVLKIREILDTPGQAKIYDSKMLTQHSSLPHLVGA